MSPSIRSILATYPNLLPLLTSIDTLRGQDRERTLQKALGIAELDHLKPSHPSDDVLALRALAEAVEHTVREDQSTLGLDWEAE